MNPQGVHKNRSGARARGHSGVWRWQMMVRPRDARDRGHKGLLPSIIRCCGVHSLNKDSHDRDSHERQREEATTYQNQQVFSSDSIQDSSPNTAASTAAFCSVTLEDVCPPDDMCSGHCQPAASSCSPYAILASGSRRHVQPSVPSGWPSAHDRFFSREKLWPHFRFAG